MDTEMMLFNMRNKKFSLALKVSIILLSCLLVSTNQASAKMKPAKFRSPLEVEIKLMKESFRVGEPINGKVFIKNTYPSALPAVFTIKLILNDKLFSEQTTAIKKVPMGTSEFTFQEFRIPYFNNQPGAEGEWRIHIVQLNMDESYAKEVKVSIVSPAIRKEPEKKLKIKKLF